MRTSRSTPTGSSPSTAATRCSASSGRASRTSRSVARDPALGHPVPDRGERRVGRSARTARGIPRRASIYVWFDALINYITGAGFPDDPAAFAHWWPADLHVIGKDINRFHTIFWPAMLMSAGHRAAAPGLGPRLAARRGGERMSKSRGNFLDPTDVVAALGADGARYVTLREVAFDRDTEVSWDCFVRRYNADLANDFGNLVNRTVTMAGRYLGGERPAPRPAARGRRSRAPGRPTLAAYTASARGPACSTRRSRALGLRRRGEQVRRRRAAVGARQGGEGRRRGAAAAERVSRDVLGDLVEAVPARSPSRSRRSCPRSRRASSRSSATPYPYAADGNGGPPLLDELALGRARRRARHARDAVPLFPRLDVETAAG